MFKFFKSKKTTDETQVGMPVYTGTVDEDLPEAEELLKLKEDIINKRTISRRFASRAEVIEAIKNEAQKGDSCTIIRDVQIDDELKDELAKKGYRVNDTSDGKDTFITWKK